MQRMEFQARSPATAVQLLLHVQDSAENACSVRTGYCVLWNSSYSCKHDLPYLVILLSGCWRKDGSTVVLNVIDAPSRYGLLHAYIHTTLYTSCNFIIYVKCVFNIIIFSACVSFSIVLH